jgi:glucose-6-phosphate isomerase
MFFEIATGISGELYGINAYNQPGVEAGKQAMKRLLS